MTCLYISYAQEVHEGYLRLLIEFLRKNSRNYESSLEEEEVDTRVSGPTKIDMKY